MKLEDLRTAEDRVKRELEAVRSQLVTAIAAVNASEHAARELAAMRDARRGSEGAYRDASEERARELQAQADGLALAHGQRVRLRREEARLLDELERTRVALEKLGIRHSVLPVLDGIPASGPCVVRWDEMTGDGDARTCAHCKTTVLSLAMTEPEHATTLLASCGAGAHFHRRADGTIIPRNCPAAASRQRFWAIAPMAALALVIVIGGFAFAMSIQHERSHINGRIVDLHQFESHVDRPPGVDPPPAVPTIVASTPSLRGATTLHLFSSFETLDGPYADDVRLTRHNDLFDVAITCSKRAYFARRTSTIAASLVDAFLDAVSNRNEIAHAPKGVCPHTDDYPHILVHVVASTTVDLSVENCSYQWSGDGFALAPDVGEDAASRFVAHHPAINEKYVAMMKAIATDACAGEIPNGGRHGQRTRGTCDYPVDADMNGRTAFKPECL